MADYLAHFGVKFLSFVDPQILEKENIPRHYLEGTDLGESKAVALAHRLREALLGECSTEGLQTRFEDIDPDGQRALVSQVDVVVGATDDQECQRRINEVCVAERKPAVYPAVWMGRDIRDAEAGSVLRVLPDEVGPCFACARRWLPPGVRADGMGGTKAEIDAIASVAAQIVMGILDPEDQYGSLIEPDFTETIVHSALPPSASIAHLFDEGNQRPIHVPLPRDRCPVCGRHEPSVPEPTLTPPPPDPERERREEAQWMADMFAGAVAREAAARHVRQPVSIEWWRVPRVAWFLTTVAAGLFLFRTFEALRATPGGFTALGFPLVIITIIVVWYGLYRTFRRRRRSSRPPQPGLVWLSALLSVAFLIAGVIVVAHGKASPARALPSDQQPAVVAGGQSTAPEPSSPAASTSASPAESTQSSVLPPLTRGWSNGQGVDSGGNYFTSVSCVTMDFCIAADNMGYAFVYTNGKWSSGTQVDTIGGGLTGVSCPTASFCAAVDSSGYAYEYTNGRWSSGQSVDTSGNGLTSISCPKAGYCVATGYSNIYAYTGGSWKNVDFIQAEGQNQSNLTSVSCPTTSVCVAVDKAGYAYTYTGGSWSSGQLVDGSGNGLTAVSCSNTSFCAAIALGNVAYIDADGSWSSSQLFGADSGAANLNGLGCSAHVNFCVAVGDFNAYTYANGGWSKGYAVQQTFALLRASCVSNTFCMAVDNDGNVYTDWRG
jgi:molybdopterin/thiamine biosynthesis adenylyltransferase